MRFLILAGAASAAYLASVAVSPQYRDDDPSPEQARAWRSCLSEEMTADTCAVDLFPTLAACQAFNASEPYAIADGAECFDNIDEAPVNQGGYSKGE